ncbi:MAG: hypothetical protein AB1758_27945 [Candidatus Eremiobacterota bacterium]
MASAAPADPANPPQAPAAPAEGEDDEKKDWTILQAAEGLTGAVLGAGIEGVGNTASSLVRLPEAVYQSYKALIKTEQIGPVLKTTIGLLLPAVAVATPVLVALGSIGFGLWRGFTEGVENGIGSAVSKSAEDVKTFHNELSGKLLDELRKYESEPLEPGEEPYDIKVVEGAKGLVGATAGAAIDGVGIGLVTLAQTPRGVVKAYKEIWKSDMGPVQKVTVSLLVPPAAVLAAPLGVVGGAIYGLAIGAKEGYTNGVGAAVSKSGEAVKDWLDTTNEALKDD